MYPDNLAAAIQQGLTTQAKVVQAARRNMRLRMQVRVPARRLWVYFCGASF